MRNRVPAKREERAVALEFSPVPRKYRHDGWTPERQKAFIEALADTGSVTRAAGMVNMAQANCYTLRRAAGAEAFRRAWSAALDFGVARLKDIAFERAIEGQLVPVFVGGKLMGFRRKRNDALLMFCLRHYGEDREGRRTTVNYFSTRASASAGSGRASARSGRAGAGAVVEAGTVEGGLRRPVRGRRLGQGSTGLEAVKGNGPHPNPSPEGEGLSMAEASATSVRTVVTGRRAIAGVSEEVDDAAETMNGFGGVELDERAAQEIAAALEACAQRARAAEAAYDEGGEAAIAAGADDPGESFVRVPDTANPFLGELEPAAPSEEYVRFGDGESHWTLAGAEKPAMLLEWEEAQAGKARASEDGRAALAGPTPEADRRSSGTGRRSVRSHGSGRSRRAASTREDTQCPHRPASRNFSPTR